MKKLFVGSLPWSCDDQELKTLFEKIGTVSSAKIITDRETGRSRGFGFVEMASDDDVQKAIEELNNSDFGGRTIVVKEAHDREPSRGPRR